MGGRSRLIEASRGDLPRACCARARELTGAFASDCAAPALNAPSSYFLLMYFEISESRSSPPVVVGAGWRSPGL